MQNTKVAERLAELRGKAGLSQQQVAEFVGVLQQTYGDWERGRTQPVAQHVLALARRFAVSTDYLLGATDHHSNLPPNCWIVDEDVVATLRTADRMPEEWADGGEHWAIAIPPRPRIITSVEMAHLRVEIDRLMRSRRKRR